MCRLKVQKIYVVGALAIMCCGELAWWGTAGWARGVVVHFIELEKQRPQRCCGTHHILRDVL
jgi:hypothetical protein